MPLKSTYLAGALAIGFVVGGGMSSALAQQPPAPDNTKVNKADRNKSEPTADRTKDTVNDREIMQKIRKSIMDDKSLSTYAHNVKIIARNGTVTLKGPVRSQDEKRTVETKATEIAGAGKVKNMLSVKPQS